MGKGDQKSRRGKLFKGSYGVRRKRKKTTAPIAVEKSAPKTTSDKSEPVAERETRKPSTAKKTTKSKPVPDSSSDDQKT